MALAAEGDLDSRIEQQDFLQSLPTEISSTGDPLVFFNKFWYPSVSLPGIIAGKQFQAQETDIILATGPKSGTTWLKALVFAIVRRTQYPIFDPNHPILSTNPHSLVPFLYPIHGEDQLKNIPNPSPRIIAAHVPYSMLPLSITTSKCPIIYLCRDPKDVFVSMRHFGIELVPEHVPLPKAFDKFCQGFTWYGPYWDHILEYWNVSLEKPDKVLFLKYEDMQDDIKSQVKKIAEHLGCPFTVEEENEGVLNGIIEMCCFEHLKDLDINKNGSVMLTKNKHFFRTGKVGDWKNHLTMSMAEQLDTIVQKKLRGSGLTLN